MTAPVPDGLRVPQWDIADRMRKSLRESDIGVNDMAVYLGVARNTVSTWINGKIDPSVQTLRLWALRTGVPFEWLHHGDASRPCDLRLVSLASPQADAKVYKMHYKPEVDPPVNRAG